MVWISRNYQTRLWKKHNALNCKSSDYMRWIKLPEAVSVKETETKSIQVIWVKKQICCKGLCKQTQIFTASERTFPLTLFCVNLSFEHRDSWDSLISFLLKISFYIPLACPILPFKYVSLIALKCWCIFSHSGNSKHISPILLQVYTFL